MNAMSPPPQVGAPADGLPVVAPRKLSNRGAWVFGAVLAVAGAMLFSALSANREKASASATSYNAAVSGARIASPPPLQLPPEFAYAIQSAPRPVLLRRGVPIATRSTAPVSRIYQQPPTVMQPPRVREPVLAANVIPQALTAPRVVYDAARAQPSPSMAAPTRGEMGEEGRVRATRFARPAFTVPRGTVIPAVLETAIDSTRPGAVRALVQRDVRGFDGSRVLIHRGSRLYGEYSGEIAQGQKRALVRWTRLIRPDGVTVNLDSPASDPLGRAGIEGDVDSHFLAQLGNSLLGTALNVGGTLASAAAGGGVIVLPNGQQALPQNKGIQPTLRVDHGASVSVFVAQDLDFSDVDR